MPFLDTLVYRFTMTQPGNQLFRIEIFRGEPGTEELTEEEERYVDCDPSALDLDNEWKRGFDTYFFGLRKSDSFKLKVDMSRIEHEELRLILTDFSALYSDEFVSDASVTIWVIKKWRGETLGWIKYMVGVQKVGVRGAYKPADSRKYEIELFDIKRDLIEQISFADITKAICAIPELRDQRVTTGIIYDFLTDGAHHGRQFARYQLEPGHFFQVFPTDVIFQAITYIMKRGMGAGTSVGIPDIDYSFQYAYNAYAYTIHSTLSTMGVANPLRNWFFREQDVDSQSELPDVALVSTPNLSTALFVTNGGGLDIDGGNILYGLWVGKDSLVDKHPKSIYEWLVAEYKAHLAKDTAYRGGWHSIIAEPPYGGYTYAQDVANTNRADNSIETFKTYVNEVRVTPLLSPDSCYGDTYKFSNKRTDIGEALELSPTFHNIPCSKEGRLSGGIFENSRAYYQFPYGVLLYYHGSGSMVGFVRVHEYCYMKLEDIPTVKTSALLAAAVSTYGNSREHAYEESDWHVLAVAVQSSHTIANHLARLCMRMFCHYSTANIEYSVPTDTQRHRTIFSGVTTVIDEGLYSGVRVGMDMEKFIEGSPEFANIPGNLIVVEEVENIANNRLKVVALPQLFEGV